MPSITPYTTLQKVQWTLSTSGVDLRDDDVATSGNLITLVNDAVAQAIQDASTEVDGYCLLNYSHTALAASNWIEKKTRDIAIFHLCGRRANPIPQSVQVKYEKAIADLEKVQSGQITLPDVAARKENVPVLSNQRVRNSPVPITVVETGRSTGTPEGYVQIIDQTEQTFDYTV